MADNQEKPGVQGRFVWCELMTTDVDAAAAFYQAAIGWTARDAGMAWPYTIVSAGETGVGGVMQISDAARAAGARPGWVGYIAVDDVDACAARVTAAGGTIHKPAEDIPGVGRFAVAGDPQGPTFTLFTPLPRDHAPPPPAAGTPGHVGWHELHARDRETAFAFYADLFGWTKTEAIDMGQIGIYQTFATDGPNGGPMVGGMMTRPEADPVRGWLYYFNVDAIDAAIARVTDAGGQIVHGPQPVPGGSWIAQALDPQGVMFAMVAPPAR